VDTTSSNTENVQPNAMRKPGSREGVGFLDVMEKLDDLEDAPANRFHLWRLLNGIEIVAHMMDTAAGRRDDTIKAGEIAHEQGFGRGAIGVEATIRHWLSATALIARINDIVVKALEQLEGGDTHFGENGVDLARNEESDAHSHLSVQRLLPTLPCARPSALGGGDPPHHQKTVGIAFSPQPLRLLA
jgi:hypothetical protein